MENINGLSMVESYNNLFEQIRKATTADDMKEVYYGIKNYASLYKNVDESAVSNISAKFTDRLQELLDENESVYTRLSEKAENISNRAYDFTKDKDDTQAVNSKLLQLMAELPKQQTRANTGQITSIISKAIASGVVGCKAVLGLMKYPAYIDMIGEKQRHDALNGSKSAEQQEFERKQEKELREVDVLRCDVYKQGFHLRNLAKRIASNQKQSAFING